MQSHLVCESTMGFKIRVLRTLEEIEQIRDIWEGMQRHPNADIDFFRLIVESREEILRPHVLLLEEGGEPRAMLIGRLEMMNLECRLGYKVLSRPQVRSLTVVYGGALGEPSHPYAAALVDELYAELGRGEADVVLFNGLQADSDLCLYARRRPGLLSRDYLAPHNPHWQLLLPDTFDEYMQRFKSKRRNEMRRNERLFEKAFPGQIRIELIREPERVKPLCEAMESIARQTYQRGLNVGFVHDIEYEQRLRLAAERGWLRAYLLYVGETPGAFEVATHYGKTLYLDCTGYDPNYRRFEPGTVLHMKMVDDLCRNGIHLVDYGFGDAEYKQRYGNKCWMESSVLMFAPHVKPIRINVLRTAMGGSVRVAESLARRSRFYAKVKKIWRSHAQANAGQAARE